MQNWKLTTIILNLSFNLTGENQNSMMVIDQTSVE